MDSSGIDDLKSVLFINFGGIGDEILFFPTIKDFKDKFPECKVSLLLEPRSASCQSLTNTIDSVIKFDVKSSNKIVSFLKIVSIIRKGNYDAVISSGSNPLISLMLYVGGSKIRIGYNNGKLSKKLLTDAVPLVKSQYAGNMYHDLLKGIGINTEPPTPEVIIEEETLEKAREILGKKTKPRIIIHPGVSKLSVKKGIIKSWPEKKWYELICKLLETEKCEVILAGGPDDDEVIKIILDLLEKNSVDKTDFLNIYGKTKNLEELGAVIKESDLLLCVDSAPMHIGVGLKSPLVAIFGPTDPKLLLPDYPKFIALRKDVDSCLPCAFDLKLKTCTENYCLDVSVDQMFAAIEELAVL